MDRCFVLFTDYGMDGPYVGLLHSVLESSLTGVQIIDLQHDLPPFRPRGAGILLERMPQWLPLDAWVIGVVDPGVGGGRAGLVLDLEGRRFVGPDNGLFTPLLRRAERIRRIEEPPLPISANVTADSGERDRLAHRSLTGVGFLLRPVAIGQVGDQFAHRLTPQVEAVRTVQQAVEDGICQGRLADVVVPVLGG